MKKYIRASREELNPYVDELDKYLPRQGEGETKATQISTAVSKLLYKWYNDGDVFDNNYGLDSGGNDLSSFANWLYNHVYGCRPILDRIYNCMTDQAYEHLLRNLAQYFGDAEKLESWDQQPKEGSVYDETEPFSFSEYMYDDEDDEWYEYDYDEADYEEEY